MGFRVDAGVYSLPSTICCCFRPFPAICESWSHAFCSAIPEREIWEKSFNIRSMAVVFNLIWPFVPKTQCGRWEISVWLGPFNARGEKRNQVFFVFTSCLHAGAGWLVCNFRFINIHRHTLCAQLMSKSEAGLAFDWICILNSQKKYRKSNPNFTKIYIDYSYPVYVLLFFFLKMKLMEYEK